ncbi:FAD-dependent oxidoreductase [uncultured Paludibaculum sp.]|uniref:FAD-dependent oxidoreductase n=1 Tax=uncultured Paludibaculum sp. TaxID=1765020 RepID=UPI002AABD665|nr:FAD-dependent oxidoreductase [uncultured Paludibaculum sp.]
MKRRDLFTAFPFTGYSLAVMAQDLLAQERPSGKPNFDIIAPPRNRPKSIPHEPNMTLVELQADVFVAGGGLAGVCAALAAARNGARVVLVQDRSRLGGNSSSEVKMHVVGANSHRSRPGWREGGLVEEIRLDDAAGNPQRSFEMWDMLLYDKVISEKNITLLLETTLYSVVKKGEAIDCVMARCDKSEHLYRVHAPLFVDCTGDSRLGLEAGALMRTGRETRSEFNESLAPEKADEETLGSSILFTSRNYGRPMPFTPPTWARKVTREQLRFRPTKTWEYGYWWVEWGGDLNTIWDNERIRYELLAIALGVWDYIKNSDNHPDSANWALDWLGMMPGKRGSRRMVGDHLITQHDLLKGDFDDAVAIGGWPMDDHPPGGFDRSDLPPNTVLRTPEVYNIPLRALYSKNVPNLMMAGRNISATHAAFTSTRVMATCACVGQAVGTAAAQCISAKILPRQLAQDRNRVVHLQQTLLLQDQSLRGVKNEDPLDLARRAKVQASGSEEHYPSENVVDGWVRDIPGREIHQWAGRLSQDGAWIKLKWPQPVTVSSVQLTFDTGFQRELMLSGSDDVTKNTIRAPQPETVRDYRILAGDKEVAVMQGNHQRLRRHQFAAVTTDRVRLHITATNGSELARLFEIRCYA